MIRFACPRCRAIQEAAPAAGGTTTSCISCGQRIEVPGRAETSAPPANKTILGDLLQDSGRITAAPTSTPPVTTPSASTPSAPIPLQPPVPPPVPPEMTASERRPRRSRYEDRYDDYDDFDDYRPSWRGGRISRVSRDISTRAAFSGFLCALVGMGLSMLTFFLWFLLMRDWAVRPRDRGGIVFLFGLGMFVSFILTLMGTIFSSRGLDPSNDHNRGLAVAGLTCGIIGLVLSSIFGLFFLFCGILLWSAPW